MKKFVIILLIILLYGCDISKERAFNNLDMTFSYYTKPSDKRANNNTPYYSFYLPSDIYELEYDSIFHHLVFNCSDFMMNLNVNAILSNDIFDSDYANPYEFLSNYEIYSNDNLYTDSRNIYKFSLYDVAGDYLFSFYSNKISCFGSTTLTDASELARHLMVINDTTNVDNEKVVDSYYTGTMFDFTKEQINLFDTYHSIEGNVSDLLPE